MRVAWVEGWNEEGDYVSDSVTVRDNETDADAIARALQIAGIVEVGQTEVTT